MKVRLLLDEDVHFSLAIALRKRGFEVLHVQELERKGMTDREQLNFLDEPFKLKPGAKLLIVILPEQQASNEYDEWRMLSKKVLSNAYGKDEVEYSVEMVKEVNPEYEGR